MDVLVGLERGNGRPLHDQIYDGLRQAILDGRLASGARLPSRRAFAADLGVARFTVEDAYARLEAEGYIAGRRGSGTYVTFGGGPAATGEDRISQPRDMMPNRAWSTWGRRVVDHLPQAERAVTQPIDFRHGLPAIDVFPQAVWRRLLARESRTVSPASHGYGSSLGYRPLREAIAAYLGRSRALRCEPDQVVIASGCQQIVDVVARLWLDAGDRVVVEEPGYPSVRQIFSQAGAQLVPVPVDSDGLQTDCLPERSGAKLLYVTPSHHYPTGGVLPLARRAAVLEWARRRHALVIEDDYDGEFRYGARPVEPLAALDRAGSVIYVGTFSKVLYPALRLGYAILPPDLVTPFVAAKALSDRHQPTLLQATLAAFIAEGHFERHLARMRRLYAKRQIALLTALQRDLGDIIRREPITAAAGLHVLAGFDIPLSEPELVARAAAAGIGLDPASPCYLAPPPRPTVLLGSAPLPEPLIDEGIRRLAAVILAG